MVLGKFELIIYYITLYPSCWCCPRTQFSLRTGLAQILTQMGLPLEPLWAKCGLVPAVVTLYQLEA